MCGRSTAELVAAMGVPEKTALTVLRQLERDGLAEQAVGGWRLSDEAERLYGRALRLMDEWCHEIEEAARTAA